MTGTATPPAGWYRDPNQQDSERYWDGSSWTHSTRALATAVAIVPAPSEVEAGHEVEVEVDEAPPPWAAEVVAAEAAGFAPPWWKTKLLFLPLAIIGLLVGGYFIAQNIDGQSVASTDGVEANAARAVSDELELELTGSTSTTEVPIESSTTSELPAATTATAENPDLDAATEAETEAAEDTEAPTSTDDSTAEDAAVDETALETTEPDNTDAPETTTTSTTTEAPTTSTTAAAAGPLTDTGPEGVSAECLNAMQTAADIDDGNDTPEDLHPTFSVCTSEDEWQRAATFTGIAVRYDTSTWVTNGCVYNAELYELPLCTSTIDPNSGPRRIDCGDGRQPVEWPFEDDTQTNDEVCAGYFQLVCPDGSVQNIPSEAFTEEEARAALCV